MSTFLSSHHTEFQTPRVLTEFGLQRLQNEADALTLFRPSLRVWAAPTEGQHKRETFASAYCLPTALWPSCPAVQTASHPTLGNLACAVAQPSQLLP